MNILHFIGNGFDKNLGLPTSYPEFYAWYLAQPSKSKIIQNLKSQLKADRDENKKKHTNRGITEGQKVPVPFRLFTRIGRVWQQAGYSESEARETDFCALVQNKIRN